jgi:hypothetical protein
MGVNSHMAEQVAEQSLIVNDEALSSAVAISAVSAQSAVIASSWAMIYATTACFIRRGANPTALSDGTDQYIPADTLLRVALVAGEKLAFKTTAAAGTVYITPGA